MPPPQSAIPRAERKVSALTPRKSKHTLYSRAESMMRLHQSHSEIGETDSQHAL